MSKKPIKKLADLAKEALDMSKEARMARAEKMGFDTSKKYFHGTKADIQAFDPNVLGGSTNAPSARRGFFFTNDASTASDYAGLSKTRSQLRGTADERLVSKEIDETHAALVKKYGEKFKTPDQWNRLLDGGLHLEDLDEAGIVMVPEGEPLLSKWKDVNDRYTKAMEMRNAPASSLSEQVKELSAKIKEKEQAHAKRLGVEMRRPGADWANSKTWSEEAQKSHGELVQMRKERMALTDKANKEAETIGANVLPVNLKMKNPYVHDFKGQGYRDESYNDILKKAQDAGHDSVLLRNTYDPADSKNRKLIDVSVVFDPSQIRSVNAKFDPKKKKSGNILAGGAVAALVAAGMSQEDAEAAIIKVNPNAKAVKTVEDLLRVAQEQKLLHHATTKKAIESIAKYGLEPQEGKIVQQAYGDTIKELGPRVDHYGDEVPGVSFLSDTPAGYFSKWQIELDRANGKSASIKDVQKDGGVGLFRRSDDIYRADPKGEGMGPDLNILQSENEALAGDYPHDVPHWVEPGDYFTSENQKPDYIVTGKELKQYLQKADPHYNVYADGKYPNVEGFAEQHNLPPKSSKAKKIAGAAGAATLAASNDALAADLNSPVASGMGEVASQAGHAMERFDAYTANPFRKFLNSALEGKGIIQSAREGVQAFGAEKPTTGEEVAKNFLSLSPNQNLGFPTADGGKDYPLAGPLGVAVDFAVDPTNIPMAKAVGPSMDAASSISRIIEQSLLKRGLVLP